MAPRATQVDPRPGPPRLSPEEEQITEPSVLAPIPSRVLTTGQEQDTDLTGRPGTPSAERRRMKGAARGHRSLLGPDAYHVGDGIRPQTTDIVSLLDECDRPTEHGVDPESDPDALDPDLFDLDPAPDRFDPSPDDEVTEARSPSEIARRMGLEGWTEQVTPIQERGVANTDPFGIHLPADEIDLLARSGGTMPQWDRWDRAFWDNETQPLDPNSLPPHYGLTEYTQAFARPLGIGAAIAVVAFGMVAVVALSVSAWLAITAPGTTASAADAFEQRP